MGAEGHFDGVSNDNLLIGWAAKSTSSNSLSVWLQCNELDPIKLKCDNYRGDNGLNLVSNYYGFEIYIYDLPKEWLGKSVFCSFDKDGLFKLPQDKKIYIKPNEKEPKLNIIKKAKKNINLKNLPFNLEKPIEELDNYKKIFEEVNNRLNFYVNRRKKFNTFPLIGKLINYIFK